ncbi:MAG: DUF4123 domain-containing protein [Marivita sp.]|uniref:DUF4123 domain-containing protein n=1 Tax=Marivita sp. TaxID=2003365 RepID=UPI003EF4A71E
MSTLADALLTACAEAPTFAVLDGAQFDNLPDALREGEFVARSLYLDRGDNNPDQVITAPHLVLLDERPATVLGRAPAQTVPALLDLLDGKPAAVFWQCPAGEEVLFRHLRGINMIMIPKEELLKTAPLRDEDTTDETHARVVFRHCDANVMAQTLPALTATEAARFFGPSTGVVFAAAPDWSNGQDVTVASKPDDLPTPKPGPLRLGQGTIDRMNGTRFARRQTRINAYLRKVAPEHTKDVSDEDLKIASTQFMKEAEDYGITSEAGQGKWCYLQVISGGELCKFQSIDDIFSNPHVPSDRVVSDLLKSVSSALRSSAI